MPDGARAALYLRVSTTRQAEVDLSIPDQHAQTSAYCARHSWRIVAEYVEPGASAMGGSGVSKSQVSRLCQE
ncbi:recombinase family protein, partial [Methylosinus sp. KRF6]|uniref:recombinase family protein n=1 Tax=Methylosinus sp. KRF6 TaxID=2846853 RepID=UPI001C0C0050